MTTKTKKPRKRVKQMRIPGTEPVEIRAVSNAAETYISKRDSRMAYLKEEVEAADKLLGLMKEHQLSAYELDGYIISISSLEKVKARKKKSRDLEDNGDDD